MLPTLNHALETVELLLDENLSTEEVCLLWLDLLEFRKVVDVVLNSVEEEATEKLHSHFGDDANGRAITGKRTMFDTPAGPVHLELSPNRRKVYGARVVDQLSSIMATPDGELVEAVPAAVLRAVLPAANSPEQTGYGWRWKELRNALGDEMYGVLVTETPLDERLPVLRAGEMWQR